MGLAEFLPLARSRRPGRCECLPSAPGDCRHANDRPRRYRRIAENDLSQQGHDRRADQRILASGHADRYRGAQQLFGSLRLAGLDRTIARRGTPRHACRTADRLHFVCQEGPHRRSRYSPSDVKDLRSRTGSQHRCQTAGGIRGPLRQPLGYFPPGRGRGPCRRQRQGTGAQSDRARFSRSVLSSIPLPS